MAKADGQIIIDSSIQTDGVDAGVEDIKKGIEKAKTAVIDYGDSVQKWIENYEKQMSKASSSNNEFKKEVESLSKELKELEDRGLYFGDEEYDNAFLQLQKINQALKDYKKELTNPTPNANPFGIDTISGKIINLETQLKRLIETGKGLGDEEYDKLYKELAIAKEYAKEYAAELAKTPKMVEKENELLAQKQAREEAAAKREEQRQAAAKAREEARIAAEEKALEIQRAKEVEAMREQDRLSDIADSAQVSSQKVIELRNELAKLQERQLDLEKAGVGLGHLEYDQNTNRISQINAELKEYQKQLVQTRNTEKQVTKDNNKFNKSLKDTQKSSKGANRGLGQMLKTMILYRILGTAVSAVINGIKEGTNNLSQYSDDTNQALSLLMSRLTQLKNALATAFSPIIEYAAPALAKLISLLSEAVTWTSELLAALTGKDTFVKAVQVQQDYASSLDKTSDSTKEAAEETEKSIAPFDDLIQIQKSATKTDKENNNKELLPSQMFETAEVSNEMKGLAAAFGNAIDSIKKKAVELKETFMSGFWDGLGDYKPRLQELKSDLDKIGGYLKDIFTDTNVTAAAGRFVNSFVNTIGKFVGALASIGLTIATNIVGGIESYLSQNVERIKAWIIRLFDVGTEINTLLGDFFVAFADVYSVFASQTAQDITGSIIQIFADVFGGILELTLKFVRDVLDMMLTPFIENKDKIKQAMLQTLEPIKTVIQSIADTVRKTVDGIVALYDDHIHLFFISIRDGMTELYEKVLDGYTSYIVPVLDKLANKFKEVMEGPVGDAIDSAIQFIGKLVDALKLLWEDVIVPFIGWIIDNVIPSVAPVIEYLGELLFDTLGRVAEFVDGVFDVLSGLIDFIVGIFKGDLDAAFKGLGEVFNGLKDMANAIFGDIIKIIEKVVGWIEKAVEALSGLFQKSNSASLDYSGYSGSSRSYSAYSAYAAIPYKVPMLATGTVVPPRAGISYFGIGDNNHEPEVVSPLSTMKQALKEAIAESGLAGGNRDIHIDMYVDRQRFASAVYKMNNEEKQRVGIRMVTQNG